MGRTRRPAGLTGPVKKVQTYGRKKNSIAVASCTPCGKDPNTPATIRVNGIPLNLLMPEGLRLKAQDPVLVLGKDKYRNLNIRVRVRGGGQTAQVYAVRQAIAKALVAWYQKYVDEKSKMDMKQKLMIPDAESPRSLAVTVPALAEPSPTVNRIGLVWRPQQFTKEPSLRFHSIFLLLLLKC